MQSNLPLGQSIYQLRITLEELQPPIWRRILVPGNILLPDLHVLLQAVMGWGDTHMHSFRTKNASYGLPIPEFAESMNDETLVSLADIAPSEGDTFHYEYDFGDDWQHAIVVEKKLPEFEFQIYPSCIAGKRACPLEDSGGPFGYSELLNAVSNPDDESHAETIQWIGGDFDPEAFSCHAINAELSRRRMVTSSFD